MRLETRLAQIGTKKETGTGAVSFPVYFSTAYEHRSGGSTGYDYARTANPTRDVLEESIARLEGGDEGFACSSGMAAIHTVMGLFKKGDHFIVSIDLYGGTYRLFQKVLSHYGLSFTFVDLRNPEEVEKALQPNTRGIFIESPTNPLMRVIDLKAICQWAKKQGLCVIADNTFMTPYFQQPLLLGADIVVHSATKYLGGHNDVLAGLIVAKEKELAERIRFVQNSIGATLGPLDSWLLMRGMKTLALRMQKHQQNAQLLADFLARHRLVDKVFYPSLDPAGKKILDEQARGYGGMISFRVKDAGQVPHFLKNLKVIAFTESLGGVESLLTYPATQTHADVPAAIREKTGVCDRLLRLSAGIEHIDDLVSDLDQALEQAAIQTGWK
ncbi:aminotransferase class I/II-fold pyridoxal phosphate-dependent enzyme [Thermoactinomyces mirandus]|uniref:Aminotransferase class I/II-fold pyridoxal phosphate-dependent enzyme n=1 Tax=Thermoactinomyces mirandus TaxID=2756294 RepID=A0A7W2AQ10_9BACL|nr:aminotransferase class I/II-fold pyridoxal phosphate-dependent enzyme [Thermoactinomyces mirandus]MBA4600787.1 aminotransferase class I/II-fold pyridoxal phosphate-dependent enzyme [Thermoactinomyces mirandus]